MPQRRIQSKNYSFLKTKQSGLNIIFHNGIVWLISLIPAAILTLNNKIFFIQQIDRNLKKLNQKQLIVNDGIGTMPVLSVFLFFIVLWLVSMEFNWIWKFSILFYLFFKRINTYTKVVHIFWHYQTVKFLHHWK